jgi:hypothetical protein
MNSALRLVFVIILMIIFSACGNKKKDNTEKFFPALSFIQSQVAHVDTSLYSIRKIIFTDSLKNDTIYIPREEFRKEANDFLTIPDLSASKFSNRYTETKDFDETMNRFLLIYIPVKPEKEEIQRQEILIKQDSSEEDKVTNIIINYIVSTKDSTVQKKMLWNVDKSFQIITTKQLNGKDEKTSTIKIIWNEDE